MRKVQVDKCERLTLHNLEVLGFKVSRENKNKMANWKPYSIAACNLQSTSTKLRLCCIN